jgi:hypothetical protein
MPPWLKGRASLYFDPTDDLATGTIPADLTADSPFTILCRIMPRIKITATDRGAVSFGTVAANQAAFLGEVVVGGRAFIGGGLIGNTLADTMPAQTDEWVPAMLRYAGGAAGAMTLVVKDRSTSTVATANIQGVVAELGRIRAAGTCLGGCVSDARILSRAISDREYDDWRDGIAEPVTTRRWWSCENPGYGATVTEEIGRTADVVTGGLWSADVPFRRIRVVEDIASCYRPTAIGNNANAVNHADLNPGAGSFGMMGWVRSLDAGERGVVGKGDFVGGIWTGWELYWAAAAHTFNLAIGDGVAHSFTSGKTISRDRWSMISLSADRDLGLAIVRVNGSPCLSVSIAALGSVDNAARGLRWGWLNGVFSAMIGRHNDWLWRKGAVFSWDEIDAYCYDSVTPVAPAGSVQIGWAMREGAGTSAFSIPAGYTATLSSAAWSSMTRCHARTSA